MDKKSPPFELKPPGKWSGKMDIENAKTIADAIEQIRYKREGDTTTSIGERFEQFVMHVLPLYEEHKIKEVIPFKLWNERGQKMGSMSRKDMGIDLIGILKNGLGEVAIQCKCHKNSLTWDELSTFLAKAEDNRTTGFSFKRRLIVTTSYPNHEATKNLKDRGVDVLNILYEYGGDDFDYHRMKPQRNEPWSIQKNAISACIEGLSDNKIERGRLIMPCGAGKTFCSLRVMEGVGSKTILFVAPSIALVSQARKEWMRQCKKTMRCIIVCSDDSAGQSQDGTQALELLQTRCPVIRDPVEIARFITNPPKIERGFRHHVVFCTYQSLDKVKNAQKKYGMPTFDLIVIDEAHRTTGIEKPKTDDGEKSRLPFQSICYEDVISGHKRLFMTATPLIYSLESKREAKAKLSAIDKSIKIADMSDHNLYGPELYRLRFKDAVNWRGPNNEKLLSDYRVIILYIPDSDISSGMKQRLIQIIGSDNKEEKIYGSEKTVAEIRDNIDKFATRVWGVAQAVNGQIIGDIEKKPEKLNRVLGFGNNVGKSKFFADSMSDAKLKERITKVLPEGKKRVKLLPKHLDASDDAATRAEYLYNLSRAKEDEAHIICNVGLFGEGVDVPSLDAIVFFEERKSPIAIVQAVGRVMRSSPSKDMGYVIIPVIHAEKEETSNRYFGAKPEDFKVVLETLAALQSHDERITEDFDLMVKICVPTPPNADEPNTYSGGSFLNPKDGMKKKVDDRNEADYEQTSLLLRDALVKRLVQEVKPAIVKDSGLGNMGKQTANLIKSSVNLAGEKLEAAQLSEQLSLAVGDSRDMSNKENRLSACNLAALLVIGACILHKRLASVNVIKNLEDIGLLGGKSNPCRFLMSEWMKILKQDYKPVFAPAMQILDVIQGNEQANLVVKSLAERANYVADTLSKMGYDHAGELYHLALDSAKSDGAYYTKPAAASLIAKLAISDDFVDWTDMNAVKRIKVVDPACGTGTLLMATLNRIKEMIVTYGRQVSNENQIDFVAEIHKDMVENSICGIDINPQAIQIAASNLTLGSPNVNYKNINLFTAKHGIVENDVHCGSLEILSGHGLPVVNANFSLKNNAKQVDESRSIDFPLENIDMVIMNPPFSNNVNRSEKFGEDGQNKLREREKTLKCLWESSVSSSFKGVINANSGTSYFVPIANMLINKFKGKLAMVAPGGFCTSVSNEAVKARKYLSQNFQIEYLVACNNPKDNSFSANSQQSDCLIIAKRSNEQRYETTVVILNRMPTDEKDVVELYERIRRKELGDWGTVQSQIPSIISDGDWSLIQWESGQFSNIVSDIVGNQHLTQLTSKFSFGVAHQTSRSLIEKVPCEDGTEESVYILWLKDTRLHFKINCNNALKWHKVKQGNFQKVNKEMEQGSGHLLITRSMRTTSTLCLAVYSDKKTIGGYWTPVITNSKEEAKALSVWFNSTLMWIYLLNNRGRSFDWVEIARNSLKKAPIPILDDRNICVLLEAYNKVKGRMLCRMRDGANDETRDIIDVAVANVSRIDVSKIREWRRMLASDNTIQGSSSHHFRNKS